MRSHCLCAWEQVLHRCCIAEIAVDRKLLWHCCRTLTADRLSAGHTADSCAHDGGRDARPREEW